jgi:hypothetical protein
MPNGSNSAAMRASGRIKRGQHSQSIEPSRPTNQGPKSAWSSTSASSISLRVHGLPADTRGRYSGTQGDVSYSARSASLLHQTIGGTRGGKRKRSGTAHSPGSAGDKGNFVSEICHVSQQFFNCDREIAHSLAGRVIYGICNRWRHRDGRQLAKTLGAQRARFFIEAADE